MTTFLAVTTAAAIGAVALVLLRRRLVARRSRLEGNAYLRHITRTTPPPRVRMWTIDDDEPGPTR